MADEKEIAVAPTAMEAADELAELDGGKTAPGPIGAAATGDAASPVDAVLAEANAEVPVPIAMSPAEVDARADAVEAVEEEIEAKIAAESPVNAAPRRSK